MERQTIGQRSKFDHAFDVRFWHLADIDFDAQHVRLLGESGHMPTDDSSAREQSCKPPIRKADIRTAGPNVP